MTIIETAGRYKWWILGAVGLVIGWLLYRKYATAAQNPSDLSAELQFQQLQSAQQLTNDQYQSQLDLTAANAKAQVSVIDASYAGQAQLENIGATSYKTYLDTQLQLNTQNNTTSEDLSKIQANTYTDIASLQADLYKSQLRDSYDFRSQLLAYIDKHSVNTAGALASSSAAAILLGASGAAQAAGAVAAGTSSFALSIPGVGSVGYRG
jgi:hypothetical protein